MGLYLSRAVPKPLELGRNFVDSGRNRGDEIQVLFLLLLNELERMEATSPKSPSSVSAVTSFTEDNA